jgi:hypothetical protein
VATLVVEALPREEPVPELLALALAADPFVPEVLDRVVLEVPVVCPETEAVDREPDPVLLGAVEPEPEGLAVDPWELAPAAFATALDKDPRAADSRFC